MAKVQVMNVVVLDNPSAFLNPFQFEITFECLEDLQEDLEWRIIYVGSAESEAFDQVLDTVYVGPVPQGRHMFVFQADPPDPAKIPVADVVGVTVVLLTCAYRYIILCTIYYSSRMTLRHCKASVSVDVSKKG
jgi:histone chaperone ASF1